MVAFEKEACTSLLRPMIKCGKYLYARYLCSRDALGLKAEPVGQARRATIGYLVCKASICMFYGECN